jgi:hypothetical protein
LGSSAFVLRRRNPASLNLIVRRNMKRRHSIPKILAICAVVTATVVPTLAVAVWQVLHGRGAAVYTNVYGLPIPYTSVLITVGALILALGVAYISRLVYLRRSGLGEVTELREFQSQAPYTDPGDSK